MRDVTHDTFVRGLAPETRAALTAKADGPGLVRLATHVGAILVLGWLIARGWWALMLPQGVLIVFLFTLMHECVHRTAFATRWINDRTAELAGFLLLLPPEWFRLFHFAHHRHTQDPDRDPELAHGKPEIWPAYALHVSGLPVWWGALKVLARNALGRSADPFVPPAARARVTREARVLIAAYATLATVSLATGSAILLKIWIIPALIGQPFLRLYLLAEHGRCPLVADMFENSRTTFTNRIVRWIAWNMPYHSEHHAFPTVPFHRLPDLHRLAAEHLRTTENGYMRFTARYAATLGKEIP